MKSNYFKIGLYIAGTLTVLVVVYLVYRAFKRAGAGIGSIGDTIQDNRVNKDIATNANIPLTDVDQARAIAKNVAVELETFKDMSTWDKTFHVVTDSSVSDALSAVKSAAMMRVVADIYKNEMTATHSLYADLKDALSSAHLRTIKFIEAITTK